MIKGNTKDHKDYGIYSWKTKTELIRDILSVTEKYVNKSNELISEHQKNIDNKSIRNVQIQCYKEDIILLKEYINELEETIEPTLKKKKISLKQTYLIKNKRNNLYKIGRSNNPKNREKTLQSEEPLIEIVKTWDEDIEGKLHIEYNKYRVRGEWFNLNEIQVRYICTKY
tara:strand:+ start:49 stop:558 length:510 start_codon:yes stop_codon:yes gene_type:complete